MDLHVSLFQGPSCTADLLHQLWSSRIRNSRSQLGSVLPFLRRLRGKLGFVRAAAFSVAQASGGRAFSCERLQKRDSAPRHQGYTASSRAIDELNDSFGAVTIDRIHSKVLCNH